MHNLSQCSNAIITFSRFMVYTYFITIQDYFLNMEYWTFHISYKFLSENPSSSTYYYYQNFFPKQYLILSDSSSQTIFYTTTKWIWNSD